MRLPSSARSSSVPPARCIRCSRRCSRSRTARRSWSCPRASSRGSSSWESSKLLYLQILANGLVLGGLYACIAVGFSLVWGVLNVINMLHGSFIVLGGYLAFFGWQYLGLHPLLSVIAVSPVLFLLGWGLQYGLINRVVAQPVLTTLTLTFGLDMIVYNFMTVAFTATPRRVALDLGSLQALGVVVPLDRVAAMVLALSLTGLLFFV